MARCVWERTEHALTPSTETVFLWTWLLGLRVVTLLRIVAMVRRHVVERLCADCRQNEWTDMTCGCSSGIALRAC